MPERNRPERAGPGQTGPARGSWERFVKHHVRAADIAVDVSGMRVEEAFLAERDADMRRALADMARLEAGALANPDEQRMVGHYWLRDAARAPMAAIRREIETCVARVRAFARAVHGGRVRPARARRFRNVLVIGIGGSALGPQFVARALGEPGRDRMTPYFIDNTDPDGIDTVLATLGAALRETLTIVISKSGGTRETRNGMLEVRQAYETAGLSFGRHAVATTQAGSELDRYAAQHGFLARFPMWDWVGGRTSVLSAVGLLPAALQGIDVRELLAGARAMDAATREPEPRLNAGALLALMWFHAGQGRGARDMVVLPYKDRLELLGRYLQQLVMESLGKERDLSGRPVHQGLVVYGNKGSTDQHAYVQQLRDGPDNFFVTFVEVLRDRRGPSMCVEPGVTSGDYLSAFYQGTRAALADRGRQSVTLTVPDVTASTVGQLIALHERAVGLYAALVNINAYHQPGVEAGKLAAAAVLDVQRRALETLRGRAGRGFTAAALAEALAIPAETEMAFRVLRHLAANPDHGVQRRPGRDGSGLDDTYAVVGRGRRRAARSGPARARRGRAGGP